MSFDLECGRPKPGHRPTGGPASRTACCYVSTRAISRPIAAGAAHSGTELQGRRPPRFFDPNTVETLTGSVTNVQRGPLSQGGKGNLMRLTLQTDKGPVQVFLGPANFVDAQPLQLAAGDQVQVKASRITGPKGKTIYTAAEVMKGGQVLKLRDDQGNPLWPRGQMRRRAVPLSQ